MPDDVSLPGGGAAGPRVGIPRALAYYEYYPLWRAFFGALGARLVVSPPTTEGMLSDGARLAVDEACLPVKAFYGHVRFLGPRVDLMFVPRLVSLERRVYTCPKFLGLPEMIACGVSGLPPLVAPAVDVTRRARSALAAAVEAGAALGRGASAALAAYRRGVRALLSYRGLVAAGVPAPRALEGLGDGGGAPARRGPGALRIAVIGHPYMVYDGVISLGAVDALRRLGAEVAFAEEVPEAAVRDETERLPKRLYWSFARRTMGAALSFLRARSVDGIVHLVPFGCGSDALISDMLGRFARRAGVPFMLLTVDEHSGTAGVVTRLEAFFDMVQRRRGG